MLDPYLFRNDLDFVIEQLKKRNFAFNPENYSELEARRKLVQTKTQELQNARNSSSKAIGQAKAKGEDVQPLLNQVANLGDELKTAETELSEIQTELDTLMSGIPNLLDLSVPEGKSEEDNVEISSKFHRHVVVPGANVSGEDVKVQAIAASIHTAEVIAAYQAAQIPA